MDERDGASCRLRLFGLAGWSGSGKTTLVERLIPFLNERGLAVSTVKHAHHAFDIDHPGKDSYLHREAGAREVLVSSARRWAMIHELRDEKEPDLAALLARLSPVDLVLVEGFKRGAHPKLEVWREATGKPPLWPDDPTILAVAGDVKPAGLDRPFLPLDDIPAIGDLISRLATPWPS